MFEVFTPAEAANIYWQRAGSTLSPISAGDDVDVGSGTFEAASGNPINFTYDTTIYEYRKVHHASTSAIYNDITYRYGGTGASPLAAPGGSSVRVDRAYAYDGATDILIANFVMSVEGAVATDNIAGELIFNVRDAGTGGTYTNMRLGDGALEVNTIHEYSTGYGVNIDNCLIYDGGIGNATSYQGRLYITGLSHRADGSVSDYYAIYSAGTSATDNHFSYRFGGTISVPLAAPADAYVAHVNRSYAHDATDYREIARITTRIEGAVATDNVAGQMYWLIRGSGVSASLDIMMHLTQTGLHLDNITEYTGGAGVTIEGNELKDSHIGIGASIGTEPLYVYHASSNTLALFESGDPNAAIGFKDSTTVTNPVIRAAGDDLELISGDGNVEISTNGLARFNVLNNGTIYMYYLGDDDTEDHVLAIDDSTGLITKRAVSTITGTSYWSRDTVGTPFLYPTTTADEIHVDTINEYTTGAGVSIEGVKMIDSNIGAASQYQGKAFMTEYNQRLESESTANKTYLYSSTSGHAHQNYVYRYGGTIGTPAAVVSNTYMNHYRGYAYDGTAIREITRYSVKVDGAVATDNIAGEHHWLLRPTGISASLVNRMELNETGLRVDIINALTSSTDLSLMYGAVLVDDSLSNAMLTISGTNSSRLTLVDPGNNIIEFSNGYYSSAYASFRIGDTGTADTACWRGIFATGELAVAYGLVPDAGGSAYLGTAALYFTNTYTDTLYTDTVNERTATAGVTVDGLLIKDYGLYSPDGSASDGTSIMIDAGEPDGATNDGGSITLKAGDALSADSGSTPGAIYLMPGSPWQVSTVSQVYLGDSTYNANTIGIQATGSQTDVDLALSTKGDGKISLLADDISLWNMRVYEFISDMIITTASTYDLKLVGGAGSTDQPGRDIHIESGQGNGTGDGGNLYMYRGPAGVSGTVGDLYFGDGSSGALTNDETETNVVGYDTTTGELTYRSVSGIGSTTYWSRTTGSPNYVSPSTGGDWIYVAGGIHFDGVNGTLSADDGTASDGYAITIQAGDPAGAGNDGGAIFIKAGDGSQGIGSVAGMIYLMPGDPDSAAEVAYVYIGDSGYTANIIGIQSTGSQTDVDLAISTKGAGSIYFGTGAAGDLANDEAETNLVAYDTSTGLLTYRSVASIGGGDVSWGTATLPYVTIGSATGDIQSSNALTFDATSAVMKLEGGSGDLPEFYLRNNAGSNYRMHMVATSPPTCYLEVVHGSGKLEIIAGGGIAFPDYGGGTITGTATYALHVDTNGNIIEGALSGSGVSFGNTDQIPHMNAGTPGTDFDYSSGLTFHASNGLYTNYIGVGEAASNLVGVHSKHAATPGIFERNLGTTIADTPYAALSLRLTTTSSDIDTGPFMYFQYEDASASTENIAAVGAMRAGVDDTGILKFFVYTAGVRNERMSISSNGTLVLWNSADDTQRFNITNNVADEASIYVYDGAYQTLRLGTNVASKGLEMDGPTGNAWFWNHVYINSAPAAAAASGLTADALVHTNAIGIGCALYLNTDGAYDSADADAVGTMPVSALALNATAHATLPRQVLLVGFLKDSSYSFSGAGAIVYASGTLGQLTTTAPSGTGDFVQAVGIATSTTSLYFNPDFAMVEIV